LEVDTVPYGDGYIHRSTRGLNPARPAWSITVPVLTKADIDAINSFLETNAAAGFWFTPPDSETGDVFVVCDEWAVSVADKSRAHNAIGTFSATFVRSFNPQPIS
jgi:phage-related protein